MEKTTPSSGAAMFLALSPLGLAQIVSWGSLYYSISILAKPVAASTGLSELELFTAFSIGLLVSGLTAPLSGKIIDRFGGRAVMTAGSLAAACAFILLATAGSSIQVYAGWIVAGLAMSATLYDSAFATLRRRYPGAEYRRAVTMLTLFGGLASTAFWPLSEALSRAVAWRGTYLVFAALHVLCAIVYFAMSPDRLVVSIHPESQEPGSESGKTTGSQPLFRDRRYVLIVAGFACAAFVFSAVSAFAVRVLVSQGFATETVLWIVGLIGPFQVGGRLIEYLFARHLSVRRVGIITHGAFVAALGLWALSSGGLVFAVSFAVIYGAANGVMTIVRGITPVFLFGGVKPGRLLGGIALPSALSRAAAPGLFALILHMSNGPGAAIAFTASMGCIAIICYVFATIPARVKPYRA